MAAIAVAVAVAVTGGAVAPVTILSVAVAVAVSVAIVLVAQWLFLGAALRAMHLPGIALKAGRQEQEVKQRKRR